MTRRKSVRPAGFHYCPDHRTRLVCFDPPTDDVVQVRLLECIHDDCEEQYTQIILTAGRKWTIPEQAGGVAAAPARWLEPDAAVPDRSRFLLGMAAFLAPGERTAWRAELVSMLHECGGDIKERREIVRSHRWGLMISFLPSWRRYLLHRRTGERTRGAR